MVNAQIRLIIFFSAKDGEALYSQQRQDCGSDHELLIAKFRLKLKKAGKTTRLVRYDINQIPSTVEVTNRFKGLDLIEAWRTMDRGLWHYIEVVIKIIPKKKKCKKENGCLRKPYKLRKEEKWRQRRKGKITHLNRVPKNSKPIISYYLQRDKKAFFSAQCKEIEEDNKVGNTRDMLKKITDTKGIFHAKMGIIKDRNRPNSRRY